MDDDDNVESETHMNIGRAARMEVEDETNVQLKSNTNRNHIIMAEEDDVDLGNPSPTPQNATAEMKLHYSRNVDTYSSDMFHCLKQTEENGEDPFHSIYYRYPLF